MTILMQILVYTQQRRKTPIVIPAIGKNKYRYTIAHSGSNGIRLSNPKNQVDKLNPCCGAVYNISGPIINDGVENDIENDQH